VTLSECPAGTHCTWWGLH